MSVAALIISILALLASAASVVYIRRQAIHASQAVTIEKDRRRAERTPTLVVRPEEKTHDDPNEHEATINVTNTAPFALQNITAQAVTDRPGKYAILAVNTGGGRTHRAPLPIEALAPGQTTIFNVLLAHEGARSKAGIVLLTVHDASGDEWVIEAELGFPHSPRSFFI